VFYFSGLNRHLQNILLLCHEEPEIKSARTRAQVKAVYNKHLARTRPACTVTDRSEVEIVTDVTTAAELTELFCSTTNEDSITTDLIHARSKCQNAEKLQYQVMITLDALATIRRDNPRLGSLLDLAINRIFFFDLENLGGGSNIDTPGIIWANPQPNWRTIDGVEFLVHELTHNLLSIEELVNGLFTDFVAMKAPENFARSAIRKVPRQMNLTLHSLLVGTELLLARENWLGHANGVVCHPPTGKLLADCKTCLDSIRSVPGHEKLLTANGLSILDHVDQILGSMAVAKAA
jgi:hypothetical protein